MGKFREIIYKIQTNEANILDYNAYVELTNQEFEGEAEKVIKDDYSFLHILNFEDFINKRNHPLNRKERRMLESEVTGSLMGVGEAALVRNPNL